MNGLTSLTVGQLCLALIAIVVIVATATALLAHVRGREIQELYTYVNRWAGVDDDLAGSNFMDGVPHGPDRRRVSDPRQAARHRAALR
ncbi:hypothetical protein HDA40_001202 [Hamadaea flava]|uniref:Secreted protein n=1 Tax=Hamadaea flava TaxID=1742688 RepID=A0ABV8LQN9_9ACTN|nr:hypothetical protein [Hamadaea flava]MCP2322695.1 hypothetical protein [Hamadaea flava]